MPRNPDTDAAKQAKAYTLGKIGAEIKKARIANGFDQNEFAEYMKVTPASVSAWESGQTDISITRMIQISELLEVKVATLIGEETITDRMAHEWRVALKDIQRILDSCDM